MLRRLADDVAYYADGPAGQPEPRLLCLPAEAVSAIAAGSSIAGVSAVADGVARTAAQLAAGRLRKLRGALSPLYLPYISPISPLYLPGAGGGGGEVRAAQGGEEAEGARRAQGQGEGQG